MPTPAGAHERTDRGERAIVPGASGGKPQAGRAGKKGALEATISVEADRLIGDGALDGLDFEVVEREARQVALQLMGHAVARRLNADHSDNRNLRQPCDCGQLARYAGRRLKTFTTALG